MMEMETPLEVRLAQALGMANEDMDSCTIHDGRNFMDSCTLYNYF